MRFALVALFVSIATGCAGARPAPDEPVSEAPPPEQTEAPGEPTGPAAAAPEGEGYVTAPDAPEEPQEPAPAPIEPEAELDAPASEEPPAASEETPAGVALPPVGKATWIAPEIRTLAEKLNADETPPTAMFYTGGSHAGGCLELYTFRFFYGDKSRYADVAGFERLDDAARCQAIVQEKGEPVPQRIGVFLVDFSEPLAAEEKIRTGFTSALSDLPVGTATPIPRDAEPYGAEPGTVVRRRQPPPAG